MPSLPLISAPNLEVRDWLAIGSAVLAIIAIVLNGLTFAERRRHDRRDLFLSLHERLIAADVQRGRANLYALSGGQDLERAFYARRDDFDQMNRALALFDVLALYVDQQYVDEDLVLREWGATLARAWTPAKMFIMFREEQFGEVDVWPNLRRIGPKALAYQKRRRTSA